MSPAPIPNFATLLANYPNVKSVVALKHQIGGGIDDTELPPDKQWLGGADGNTCTIRLSRTLNYSGVPIPRGAPGLRTTKGADHLNYAFAMQEMRQWLTGHFGAPRIDEVGGPPVMRGRFSGIVGIIAFDIHFSDANGHVDLWDGNTFFDEVYGMSHDGHDFFEMANRVSLWPAPGTGQLAAPPDA